MTPQREHSRIHLAATVVLRAAASTLLIGSVAFIFSSGSRRTFWFDRALDFALAYRTLWFVIFAALTIWNYWFRHARAVAQQHESRDDG